MVPLTLMLADEAATAALGRRLALLARPGDIVALQGPLGSGKSVLARAFVRALAGEETDVPSPTFTLVQTYPCAVGTVWHFDLYRLERAEEALELGIDEAFHDAISLIEWPERLGARLPARRLLVRLSVEADGDSRRAEIEGGREWAGRLAGGLE